MAVRVIVPLLVMVLFSALLYPVCGLWAITIIILISLATGAAWGAIASQLREPPPVGSPANPRPMPASPPVMVVTKNRVSADPGAAQVVFDLGDLPRAVPDEVLRVTKRPMGTRVPSAELQDAWKRAQAAADTARAQAQKTRAPVWTASQVKRPSAPVTVESQKISQDRSGASDWFDVTPAPVFVDTSTHHSCGCHTSSGHDHSCGSHCGSSCGGGCSD